MAVVPASRSFSGSRLADEIEDLLLAHGYFIERHGRLTLVISDGRGPNGFRAALDEAKSLAALGARIERLDLDLVTKSQIAEQADVSKQAVQAWTTRESFPEPHTALQGPVWAWSDVVRWPRSVRGRYAGPLAPTVRETEYFKGSGRARPR